MDLNYKILWVEDTDEAFNTLSRRLTRYIESRNLNCIITRIKSVDEFKIQDYDLNTYEILIIDYKLKNNTVGQDIIKTIRRGKYVNDVLFYSSVGYLTLEKILKQDGLQGVFISERQNSEFIENVKLLIDKSIRRAENLINIRGIFMDNTSEFDENMKNIINLSWKSIGDEKQKIVLTYIINRLLKDKRNTYKKFIEKYSDEEKISLSGLLDEREFTSDMKSRLFNKIISLDTEITNLMQEEYVKIFNDDQSFKENYDKDILWYRNKLAHVKKNKSQTGQLFIGEIKGEPIVFDGKLCSTMRKNLIQYEKLFDNIYNSIEMF